MRCALLPLILPKIDFMRVCLLFVFTCVLGITLSAQDKDTVLQRRVNEYMAMSKNADFEKVMEYMHPSLFKLSPRETLIQVMNETFHNPSMEIAFDSIKVIEIGPAFKLGEASWRKTDYYMSMHLKMADASVYTPEFIEQMKTGLQDQFPGKEVRYDPATKYFIISGMEIFFAIKDNPGTQWMFLGYQKNPQLINALFPKEVIEYFKLL